MPNIRQNKTHLLWLTDIEGGSYNHEHQVVKQELIDFFDQY